MLELNGVSYGDVSPYSGIRPGTYTVSMVPAGSSAATAPVISADIEVPAESAMTVVAYGPSTDLEVKAVDDDLAAPTSGSGRIRLFQASTITDSVDVETSTGMPIAMDAAAGTVTDYAEVPAGSWTLELTGGDVTASADVNVAAGSVSTLFVLDTADRWPHDPADRRLGGCGPVARRRRADRRRWHRSERLRAHGRPAARSDEGRLMIRAARRALRGRGRRHRAPDARGLVRPWVLVAVAAMVTGGALVAAAAGRPADDGPVPEAGSEATPTATANAFAAGRLQDPSGTATVADVGTPVAVRIPSLGVSSSLDSGTLRVLAQDGSYGDAAPVGGGYGDAKYASSPSAVVYQGNAYIYATDDEGNSSYTSYDGEAWSDWQGWDDQPAAYQDEPAVCAYKDWTYVFATGEDGHLYHNSYDGETWTGWEDISGDYTFEYAAYSYVYADTAHVYATASDGYVYYKTSDGTGWSDWQAVSDEGKAVSQPYAVDWDGYDNVFWAADDGQVYWNRYDGDEWTGAKALPGDGTYGYAPYAVGYEPETTLYAYTASTDGVASYNTFDGDAWSGWTAFDGAPPVNYQPSASVHDDAQHVVYTGADGHAYYASYDGDAWSDWEDLGDNYAYDTAQYAYDDAYYLAYTGKDGDVYVKEYTGADAGSY